MIRILGKIFLVSCVLSFMLATNILFWSPCDQELLPDLSHDSVSSGGMSSRTPLRCETTPFWNSFFNWTLLIGVFSFVGSLVCERYE